MPVCFLFAPFFSFSWYQSLRPDPSIVGVSLFTKWKALYRAQKPPAYAFSRRQDTADPLHDIVADLFPFLPDLHNSNTDLFGNFTDYPRSIRQEDSADPYIADPLHPFITDPSPCGSLHRGVLESGGFFPCVRLVYIDVVDLTY